MIFVAILLLGQVLYVNSFQVHKRPRETGLNSSSNHEDDPSFNHIELWLDMRRSSVPPQTALMYLCNDLWGDFVVPEGKSFMVDSILINNRNDIQSIVTDVHEEFEDQIGMLVLENEDAFEIENGIISTVPIGKVIKIMEDEKGIVNINQNPLPVLETISKGKWSILDNETNENENSKNAVSGILQLASYGLNYFGNSSDGNIKNGGIAVTCQTESDVINICALVQSLGFNYKQTDSGILVHSDDKKSKTSTCGIKYAVVIPFDASLWKTASFVFQ